MRRIAILSLVILLPSAALAEDPAARALAQDILNRGSALFDARDASAMARTYLDDAKIAWVEKDHDTGKYKVIAKDGRSEIEALYREHFKGENEKTTSRNTVESATFVSSDLLLIHGVFEPDIAKEGRYAFSQERLKVGESWKIQNLRIYIVPKE